MFKDIVNSWVVVDVYFISAYIASDDIRISAGARASMPKITHTAARIIDSITPSATGFGVRLVAQYSASTMPSD